MDNKLKQYLISIVIAFYCGQIFAIDEDNVDNILDRLESKLDANEDSLFGVSNIERKKISEKPVKTYSGSDQIQGNLTELDEIKELAIAIAGLENKIDLLNASIQETKQNVLDKSRLNNFVKIDAVMQETDSAAIKNINIKINGFDTFSLKDDAGIWLPNKKISVYSGPMPVGSHRVDIETTIAMKHKNGLPLNGDVYRFANKTFNIDVPVENFKRQIDLNIKVPNDPNGTVEIQVDKKIIQ